MDHSEFIRAFEDCSYPRAEWVHAAHMRMAWIYCGQYSIELALKKARDGIKAYNAFVGGDPALYHETITTFYIRMVHYRLNSRPELSWDEFVGANEDLMNWWPPLIEKYYSKELLYSKAAREDFIPPDLTVLPF